MKTSLVAIALALCPLQLHAAPKSDPHRTATEKLTREIMSSNHAFENLRELVEIGHRLSGSVGAARAVSWGHAKMKSYGFDDVRLQPVTVPKWERGDIERAAVVSKGARKDLKVTALGLSIGTEKGGIKGQVVEVKSLEEAEKLGEKIKGKIVFYNRPMDPTKANTFEAYGGAADQRFSGPAHASKLGAIAAIVRSMTLAQDDHPHTGATRFKEEAKRIPSAAISTNDADNLSRALKDDPDAILELELSAKDLGTAPSFNVIGELRGSRHPNEVIVVGGHLDSWDLSPGAHDCGAGVVQSIEVLRAMKAAGLKPKRTVRAVLFMSEEVGVWGGREYADVAKNDKTSKHIAAIESDNGGFAPKGFGVSAKPKAFAKVRTWAKYFSPLLADRFTKGGGEADIEPLEPLGTALFGLTVESQRYFDYHHAATDTIDKVNPRELKLGAAAMASLAYLIGELGLD